MNWLKNNQQTFFTAVIFLLCFGLIVALSFSPFTSYDTYWHLKIGQDLLEKGLSPWVDHYSFTYLGEPVKSLPILFEVMLAAAVSTLGMDGGIQLIRLFSHSLVLIIMFYFYRQIKAKWYVIALTLPFISFFLSMRIHIRPELFDQILVIGALILYLKARNDFSNRNLGYILLLILFWANYHAVILGYVIFFGLFVDKGAALLSGEEKSLSWQRFFIWGGVIFAAGFLNPSFEHHFFTMLNFNSEWTYLITEYAPTTDAYKNDLTFFYLFWLVSLYLFIVLLIQRQYGFALICLIFAYKSWDTVRMVGIAGIIIFAIMGYALSQYDKKHHITNIRKSIKLVLVLLWITAISYGSYRAISKTKLVQTADIRNDFPVQIVKYLNDNYPEGGNIINNLGDGGYLLYALNPQFKIYIDGRTIILYPFEFFKKFKILKTEFSGASLAAEIKKYNVDYMILPLDWKFFWEIKNVGNFTVENVDRLHILYSNKQNYFTASTGYLLFPMCWNKNARREILLEYGANGGVLAESSVLSPLFEFLQLLDQSENNEVVFSLLKPEEYSDIQLRFLAHIAFKSSLNNHTIRLLKSVKKQQTDDLLLLALALLKNEQYSDAEKVIRLTQAEPWLTLTENYLTFRNKVIIINLLNELEKYFSIADETDVIKTKLEKELDSTGKEFDSSVLELEQLQQNCDFILSKTQ